MLCAARQRIRQKASKVPPIFIDAVHQSSQSRCPKSSREAFAALVEYHGKQGCEIAGVERENDAQLLAKRDWSWIQAELRSRRRTEARQGKSLVGHWNELQSDMVRRLVENEEPMAYVLGHQPFGSLSIVCDPPTLIPRPETEFMTEHLSSLLCDDMLKRLVHSEKHSTLRVLDLCTGTGCIGLLLRHRVEATVMDHKEAGATSHVPLKAPITFVAADICEKALALTRKNADLIDGSFLPLTVKSVDMMDDASLDALVDTDSHDHEPMRGFDVVVCNPPYIAATDWALLDRSVREYEDRRALVGDVSKLDEEKSRDASTPLPANASGGRGNYDGLDFYRRLADLVARGTLIRRPARRIDGAVPAMPSLAVEVGKGQAQAVAAMFATSSPKDSRIKVWTDPFGVDRAVLLWLPVQ